MGCFLLVSVNDLLHHIVFIFKTGDKYDYIKTDANFKHNCKNKS